MQVNECDVLVVGSGAAGLMTAVTAAHLGLNVIVAEKQRLLGGTTATIAGGIWVPCSRLATQRGIQDSREKALTYLRAVAGERLDEVRVQTYLDNAPRAVDFLLEATAVRFYFPARGPDYHSELPGGIEVGRSFYQEPFDGRLLGDCLNKLHPQLRELSFLGVMPMVPLEAMHFLRASRSSSSAWYVARRLARRGWDQLVYGRGTRLTNGAALIARLVKSAIDRGIPMWTSSPVRSLSSQDGRVTGAIVGTPSGDVTIRARRGVVLACGGFSHDSSLRQAHFPGPLKVGSYWPATDPAATGDGLRLGKSVGAAVRGDLADAAAWIPISLVPQRDGPPRVFPHLWGRANPGVIAVTRDGKRFVNEANSYHKFGQAMIAAATPEGEVCAFLVCDSAALRRYGFGVVRPFPVPHGRHLRSGYLMRGKTIAELALAAGIEPGALAATVDAFNRHAREGRDPAFGKGTTPYNRHMGDAEHKPNPCIAPLERPPFFAIKVFVGDIGTYAGLETDAQARVLDGDRRPISGLYSAGNDMATIFGGTYPAGGIMLGQCLTFGFIAGRNLAGLN
jgi:succinate dehydrogenase/fumarate reductase flavoprotein subunit